MNGRLRWIGALLACVGLTAGCASSSSGTSSTTSYAVVSITDVSGADASVNGMSAPAAKAYFSYLNAHGGVNGHQINFVSLDTQSQVTVAVGAFQKALSYNPVAILMGGSSQEFPPSIPTAVNAKIPVLSSGGMPDTDVYPAQPYIYSAIPASYQSAYAAASFIKRLATAKGITTPRVAVTALDSAYGTNMVANFTALQSTLGFTVVAQVITPNAGVTDFTGPAAKFAAAHPDFVTGQQDSTFVPLVMSALKADGLNVPFINFFGGDVPALYTQLNDPNYYAFRFAAFPTDPSLTTLQAATSQFGLSQYRTNEFFTAGWIMSAIVANALKNCSATCTGDQLNAQIEQTNLDLTPYSAATIILSPSRHFIVSAMTPMHISASGTVEAAAGGPVAVDTPKQS